MTYHGYGACLYRVFKCGACVGIFVVDDATVGSIGKRERTSYVSVILSVFLSAHTAGGEIVHTGFPALITQIVIRAESIEFGTVYAAEIISEAFHLVDGAPQFVAQRHHHK